MDFHFTEEQKILKETARNFLATECPSSFILEMEEDEKGYTQELWRKMADLGWMGLIIPDEYDGVGGSFLDLIVMLEEMGRACVPGPFFSTVILGALSLMEAGSESQLRQFLPKIASGKMVMTMAHLEPSTTKYDPFLINLSAAPDGDDYVLYGTKLFVPDAHVADCIVSVARTSGRPDDRDGISLFLVDSNNPWMDMSALKTIAGDKQFEVRFDGVRVSGESLLGPLDQSGGHLERILEKAALCKCAEMVGGAQKVLDMATEYAKEREQFGRPIGSFQAVQHHCSNMLINIEGSRYITYKVAWMLNENIPCSKLVSVAKAWVSDTYKKVVGLGHQVQGATAYMIEHDMPLYSRRAKIAEMTFGNSNYHRNLVARELGL